MSWRNKFSYKVYVLILTTVIYSFVVGTARLCMPVLFPEISRDLGLSLVQQGTIWGIDPFAGVFVALISGLIVDRFGIKRCLLIVCFFGGIVGALRGLSISFAMMVGLMFLFGLFVAMIPSVAQKTLAVWFPGRQYALAASILNIGWTIGAMIGTMASATVFSPALGGWRNVLLVYGIPPILLSILWQFTIKEPKKTEISVTKEGMGFRQLLSHVIRVKEIWIIGIIALGLLGTGLGIIGYLPAYLRGLGWSNTASAGAITVFSAAGGLGGLPLVILSNRIGSRTKVLIPAGIIFIVTLAFIPFTSGTMTWVMIITGGIVRGCLSPLLSAMAVEREVIGARYAGTALGLIMTLNMLGGAISPPLGNSLAGINAGFPFLLWAAISVMGLIGFFFIKEKRLGITSVS